MPMPHAHAHAGFTLAVEADILRLLAESGHAYRDFAAEGRRSHRDSNAC